MGRHKATQMWFGGVIISLLVLISSGCSTLPGINVTPSPATTIKPTQTSTPYPTATATLTKTPTSTPTSTLTITPSPTPTATQIGGAELAFFIVNENVKPWKDLGLYQFNLISKTFSQITGPGYFPIGLSPDRKYLLANGIQPQGTQMTGLYVISIADGDVKMIAENLVYPSFYAAHWFPNNLIAFVGQELGNRYIYTIHPDGSEKNRITQIESQPLYISPTSGQEGVCWTSGYKRGYFVYFEENWCTPFDGVDPVKIEIEKAEILYSPKEGYFAYAPWEGHLGIIHSPNGPKNIESPDTIESQLIYTEPSCWSPDGDMLMAIASYCSGECITEPFIVSPDGALLDTLPLNGYRPVWSPDGKYLLDRRVSEKSEEWYLYSIETKQIIDLTEFIPKEWSLGFPLWGNQVCE